MSKRQIWYFHMLGLCLTWLPVTSHAATFTLEQTLLLAQQYHPEIAMALARDEASRNGLKTALAYPNPEMDFASGSVRVRGLPGAEGKSSTLSLQQAIDLPTHRNARQASAHAAIQIAQSALEEIRLDLDGRTRQAFFALMHAIEERDLAEENQALLQQVAHRVELKVSVGEAPRFEQVKAQAEALNARSASQSAQIHVRLAENRLRSLTGNHLPENFTIQPAPFSEIHIPDPLRLRHEVLANHPQLRRSTQEIQQARALLEHQRALRVPQPTLTVNRENDPESRLWRAGIHLPVPLWDQRNGPIGEAQAQLHHAEASYQQVEQLLLSRLDQALERLKNSRQRVETYETGLLRQAEAALHTAEIAYRAGERGILEYLDAQRIHRSTRSDYLNARYEQQAAWIDIENLRTMLYLESSHENP